MLRHFAAGLYFTGLSGLSGLLMYAEWLAVKHAINDDNGKERPLLWQLYLSGGGFTWYPFLVFNQGIRRHEKRLEMEEEMMVSVGYYIEPKRAD